MSRPLRWINHNERRHCVLLTRLADGLATRPFGGLRGAEVRLCAKYYLYYQWLRVPSLPRENWSEIRSRLFSIAFP